ncbi:MAG: PKD domain-containing protein [Pseudomonadota bacterium]
MSVRYSSHKRPALHRSTNLGALALAILTTACGGGGGSSVSPPPPPPPSNVAPNAVIDADVTNGLAALPVSFSAKGSTDGDGSIASYQWDFTSDGTTDATTEDASFIYEMPGAFTATLTVTDDDGATDRATIDIQVDRRPEKIAFIGTEAISTSDLYVANDDGTDLVQLSQSQSGLESRVLSFKWSPDGQWLAFQQLPDLNTANTDLLVVSVDGGVPVLVSAAGTTNDRSVGSDFAWSPDSAQIAFTLQTGGATDTTRETYVVDRDGANLMKINGTVGRNASVGVVSPRWSADGAYIFQVVENASTGLAEGVNIFDTALGVQNSTRLMTNTRGILGIELAPSDPRICYNLGPRDNVRQIRTSDASTGVFPNSLVIGGDAATSPNERQCQWFDDDARIAFINQNSDRTEEIIIRDSEAAAPPETVMTTNTNFVIEEYAVRPNSENEVMYTQREIAAGAASDLFFAGLNLAPVALGETLPNGNGTQVFGSWSPDGSDFAYFGNLTTRETLDIYVEQPGISPSIQVTDFEGEEQARIDAKPVWSNDETRLAYWTGIPDLNRLGRFIASDLQIANVDGSGVVVLTPGTLELNAGDFAFQPKSR